MYYHFQKHYYNPQYGDRAPFVDNPVDYVKRAHELGDKLVSAGDFEVYEGMVPRFAGPVLERYVFNKSTREYAIKILGGGEAGAMRTLHLRSGVAEFENIVNNLNLTRK